MFITIITPTVQRDSLIAACESIDAQVDPPEYEHIVIDDSAEDRGVLLQLKNNRRTFLRCDHPHRNTGNTCRRNAWLHASGRWVLHLDDDNTLFSFTTLREIYEYLKDFRGVWALFPIFRHGSLFFFDPPKPCFFDTANAVVRRQIAQWPDTDGYASDAVWLQGLMNYPYGSFPTARPIVTMAKSSFGEGGGKDGQ